MPILNQLTRDALLDRTMDAANQAELISDMGAAKAHLLVADNDAKQLLTNLSDGQEVEVTGEAGRIERFNGDNQPDGTIAGGDAHAILITSDALDSNGEPIAGLYLDEGGGVWSSQDGFGRLIGYDSTEWVIYDGSNYCFRSEAAPNTTMAWDLTTWTPEGNGETGTLSQSQVFRHAEAMESNWYAIKNTVYLTVWETQYAGPFEFNGVTVGNFATVGVGWVPVCELISVDVADMWYVNSIDGDQTVQTENQQTGTTHVFTIGTNVVLPDSFPAGALVKISNQ